MNAMRRDISTFDNYETWYLFDTIAYQWEHYKIYRYFEGNTKEFVESHMMGHYEILTMDFEEINWEQLDDRLAYIKVQK